MLNKTILIIDDEDVILRVLINSLSNKVKNILTAYDGEVGYDMYIKNHIDLIITDVYLPKLTGIAIINLIRYTHNDHKTPIIVMSAYGSEIIKLNKRDISLYIQKPFLGAEVAEIVMKLLMKDAI